MSRPDKDGHHLVTSHATCEAPRVPVHGPTEAADTQHACRLCQSDVSRDPPQLRRLLWAVLTTLQVFSTMGNVGLKLSFLIQSLTTDLRDPWHLAWAP